MTMHPASVSSCQFNLIFNFNFISFSLSKMSAEYTASILVYAPNFMIPPSKPSYLVETECCYNGFEPLTLFAFRVHTHVMGK